MEESEDGHHLAVGHEARMVATTFAVGIQRVFISVREQNICITHREYRIFLLNLHQSWK